MDEKKKKSKTITKGMLTFLLAMFAICFMFFNNIISVSAKTTKQKEVITEEYTLILQERDGIKEKINGADIGLKYSSENPRVATYDETLLKATINKLACFDISKITESRDAKIIYDNGSYVISKEVYGNKVKKDTLYNNVIKAIQNGETTINLQGTNCYEVPTICCKFT